jgi:Ca2+-binding EF-hand superfamily protein
MPQEKLMLRRIAMVVLAALLMAGCATTQDQGPKAEKDALCSDLDANHDGKITKEEFLARATDKSKASEIFEKCDSGKKGYLTYDEVWRQRVMLPPEIIMMSPPVVRQFR